MTSVREDLGYLPQEPKFKPKPAIARFEGVRESGDEWESEVLLPTRKRIWFFAPTREAAIARARNFAAAWRG